MRGHPLRDTLTDMSARVIVACAPTNSRMERFELHSKRPGAPGFKRSFILLPAVRASYGLCAGVVGGRLSARAP